MAERGDDEIDTSSGLFCRIVDYGSSSEDETSALAQPSVVELGRKRKLVPAESVLSFASRQTPDDGASSSRTPSFCAFREDTLRAMGFSTERIFEAEESCGKGASLESLIGFLAATQEPSVSDQLETMGYSKSVVQKALKICGENDLTVLVDFIDAHLDERGLLDVAPEAAVIEVSPEAEDFDLPCEAQEEFPDWDDRVTEEVKRQRSSFYRGDMTGFGVPGRPTVSRILTVAQRQKPYFYFENVSCMPAGDWEKIFKSLDFIEPEFVCARHFSVARRARGYVHNLPTEGRSPLLPVPAKTIREFFPHSRPFIPAWDDRTHLGCIDSNRTAATFCKKVQNYMKHGEPSEAVKKEIMETVRRWNLIWTGPGICSPLQEDEVEAVMGYPKHHTRGAISHTDRMKSLGNSFQIDTVGYHLSALKPHFMNGIRVLSLFSGIGGAEVALHCAGIQLNFVVSVEAEECSRWILKKWWKTSGQRGTHRILDDVRTLDRDQLEVLIAESGGFDLVIGGSPCNNLSGNNRRSRTGLVGEKSKLFYEFPRILKLVREIMQHQGRFN